MKTWSPSEINIIFRSLCEQDFFKFFYEQVPQVSVTLSDDSDNTSDTDDRVFQPKFIVEPPCAELDGRLHVSILCII